MLPSAASGEWFMIWRLYFPFICVLRRLKCPALRPPQALMNKKSTTPIHKPFAGCGTRPAVPAQKKPGFLKTQPLWFHYAAPQSP
jgi:hypothetical protein